MRALCLLLFWAAPAALADNAPEQGPMDDAGAVLAAPCAGCHRAAPAQPGGIPSLTGQSAEEIGTTLRAYRSGELQGTLMNRLARGYSDLEIERLAKALGAPPE